MTAGPSQNKFSVRASALARRIGMPAVVLLAAFAFDLAFITDAAFDDAGPRFVDLLLFPGIFGMVFCALWAQKRAAVAAVAASVVLVSYTLVVRYFNIPTYSSVLANLSITEVVAGVEILFYAARRTRPGVAFAVISGLVLATLTAVSGRYMEGLSGGTMAQAMLFGGILLGGTLVFAIPGRDRMTNPKRYETLQKLNKLVMGQWPLIGMLSIALILEFSFTYASGAHGLPVLVCSIIAAVIAVAAPRRPADAMVALTAVMVLSALVTPFLRLRYDYPTPGGVPGTQIVAGMGLVITLVRAVGLSKATTRIAALSAVVAGACILNTNRPTPRLMTDPDDIAGFAVAGVLLLGISVAVGLALRSRDSERTQVIQSAISDAQTSERMALARELHDVVAHHVTGIVVQAQAAKMMGEKNPQVAVEAMGRIEDAGVEALAAMRRLVRSMRGDAPAGSSEFSEQATTDLAADLRSLIERSNHGVKTSMKLELPSDVPHEVGRSALRLVQESLTNIGKHASGAKEALVIAEVAGSELHLQVTDDGREPDRRPAGGSGGYGLIGMRERVALLHGRLSAGRAPGGGWRVEAWLPLEGEE
ncbi:sensor histidine kinase [Amycolatopsis azurea]|uniref:histidine kinase n=1 Tax=Amycolatopsis azurea DSM 43854 TaxID=1238180 RepID=M2NK06_9PSEU|nr:Two-component system sensor kinase [Amycolatopsis azurea DSM 43854]OOC00915.1 two-component sensor histidine kinase [Amycolatopsis azurea DSM 43854]